MSPMFMPEMKELILLISIQISGKISQYIYGCKDRELCFGQTYKFIIIFSFFFFFLNVKNFFRCFFLSFVSLSLYFPYFFFNSIRLLYFLSSFYFFLSNSKLKILFSLNSFAIVERCIHKAS